MNYSKNNAIKKAKAIEGDRIRLKSASESYEGILMPKVDGMPDTIVIKLDNGYDIGIKTDSKAIVEKLPQKTALEASAIRHKPTFQKELPTISLITTGGTISARVDYKLGGVKPALSPEEIFSTTPELDGIVNFKNLSSPFRIFSENMSPIEWQKIAAEVAKELNSGVEGVIVTHGTDTLHYTAAALSFMLEGLNKPVALAGAMKSPDRGSFDGTMNLVAAAHYATSDMAEVAIVMHADSSDTYCNAIRGTKARKMHTSRRDAFRPVNDIPLAKIYSDGKIEKLQPTRERRAGTVKANTAFEEKIAMLKAYPGSQPEILDFLTSKKYKGIVIEATALGQAPMQTLNKKYSWAESIEKAIESGMLVCVSTQCLYGRVNPYVYETARLMHAMGVVYLEDMLPETAYVKMGCMLGRHKPEKARQAMLENLAGEINGRLTEEQFLY